MSKYLEVNCQDINIKKDKDVLVISVKATLKTATYNSPNDKIRLINQQELPKKEAIYHELFKSQVVYPPPPPQRSAIIQQKKQTLQNRLSIQNQEKANSPNRQNRQDHKRDNTGPFRSSNIFTSGSPRNTQEQSNNNHNKQIVFQNSNGRNSIFQSSSNNQQNNFSRNQNFDSNSNRSNSMSIHSSQNRSNLFMMGSAEQNRPSLFSNPQPSAPANNNNQRRARKGGPTRIS